MGRRVDGREGGKMSGWEGGMKGREGGWMKKERAEDRKDRRREPMMEGK